MHFQVNSSVVLHGSRFGASDSYLCFFYQGVCFSKTKPFICIFYLAADEKTKTVATTVFLSACSLREHIKASVKALSLNK